MTTEVCNYGDLCRPELFGALMYSATFIFAVVVVVGLGAAAIADVVLGLKRWRQVSFVAVALLVAVAASVAVCALFYDAAWTDYRRSLG